MHVANKKLEINPHEEITPIIFIHKARDLEVQLKKPQEKNNNLKLN